jgi:hypothetical protein
MNHKIWLAVPVVALALVATEASAHRGGHIGGSRARVGVYIGAPVVAAGVYYGAGYYRPWGYGYPYGYPYGYANPYYYPPAVVTVPSAPPVYIEQAPQQATAPAATGSWYYCANPQGYYPYVKECPGGWQAVPAQPSQ